MTSGAPVPIDQWSPLSHKGPLDPETATLPLARSWSPDDTDERRLSAYHILAAYRHNVARNVLRTPNADHREYGDPTLLVQRLVAAVLGDEWALEIDGAGDDLTKGPTIGDPPVDPGDDADPLARRLYNAQLRAWQDRAAEVLENYEQAVADQPSLRLRQAELDEWFTRRGVGAVVTEAEGDAVALGDTVYALWPQADDWPRVSVIDPSGYFPLVYDTDAGEFPDRHDVAWEFVETDERGNPETYLRRLTWELVEIAAMRSRDGQWIDAEGNPADRPTLYAGDTSTITERVVDGQIARVLPWHTDGEFTTMTCVYTEAVWAVRNLKGGKLRDLDLATAEVVNYDHVDLLVDLIPVIHVPNTPSTVTGWGVSSLSNVAQVADDISTNDTDAMKASRYLSDPTIFVSGVAGDIGDTVAPGVLYKGGENGSMTVLDLAVGLEKLMAHGDRLEDRFWQNGGVPKEVLGRANAENLSGIALALKYAPFAQLVGTMRMAREHKYALLAKFAQRLAQVAGALDAGPTPPCGIRWGSFLPTNRTETVEMVATALNAKAISTQTAVMLLVSAGFPVADADAEVARIRAEDGETAKAMADATGSEQVAADFLGVDLPAAPSIELPPAT